MKVLPPPIYDELIEDDKKSKLSWINFFNSLYTGDTGTEWTPTFTNLTTVGTPTITGRYYKIGSLSYFRVDITPGTNTSSTAGTTYINNFPLTFAGNGFCIAVAGATGTNAGMIEASSNRIYVPTWTTVTVPLTVIGIAEAR